MPLKCVWCVLLALESECDDLNDTICLFTMNDDYILLERDEEGTFGIFDRKTMNCVSYKKNLPNYLLNVDLFCALHLHSK
jgi:hypothetical protein